VQTKIEMGGRSLNVALEKTRNALFVIRREWNMDSEDGTVGVTLCNELLELQQHLRNDTMAIDPLRVISPFVSIIKSPILSGPYKLLALDSIQAFINHGLLLEMLNKSENAITELVEAIIHCKFVQTNVIGDELVQLQIVYTLQCLFTSPETRKYLTDETTWIIIESLYNTAMQAGMFGKVNLYNSSENAILEAVRFVFQWSGNTEAKVNLPCALKVLGFFMTIIQRVATKDTIPYSKFQEGRYRTYSGTARSGSGSAGSGTNGNSRFKKSSNERHQISFAFQGMESEMISLILALNVIKAILLVDGEGDMSGGIFETERAGVDTTPVDHGDGGFGTPTVAAISGDGDTRKRSMKWVAFQHYPALTDMLRNDVGSCLILLSLSKQYPLAVIQSALNVFGLMYCVLGPINRVLIECFIKRVYLQALHQTLHQLQRSSSNRSSMVSPRSSSRGARSSVAVEDENIDDLNDFTLEQIEVILESLIDLIADNGFVPTLFASFDCDSGKSDVLKPLVHYIGECARLSLKESENNNLLLIRKSCASCFTQLMFTLSNRTSYGRRMNIHISDDNMEYSPRPEHNFDKNSEIDADSGSSSDNENEDHAEAVAFSVCSSRHTKSVLSQASTLMSKSPKKAFDFLQTQGMLTNPLTPSSVAKFLRIAPNLSIECVGKFLGELGHKKTGHESEGVDFHRQVLHDYVGSFEFSGQSLLDSVRIFLSAFLLPKEAQQIDRIFVAFSDHCHKSCVECVNGMLENTDVTYLMTISIIMLNTDLHNDNIRADKKMSMEKFCKVNGFYGADVKQTRSVPTEYLESIYEAILQYPIRTEPNDDVGDTMKRFTTETWKDLLLQARAYPERGFLTSPSFSPEILHTFSNTFSSNKSVYQDIRNVGKSLLLNNARVNPLELSASIHGKTWIFDEEIVRCVWQEVLNVWVCTFATWHQTPNSFVENARSQEWVIRDCIRALDSLVSMAVTHHLPAVIDTIVLILADFTGVTNGEATNKIVNTCKLDCGQVFGSAYVKGLEKDHKEKFLLNLFRSLPARLALGKLMQIVINYSDYISNSWAVVWHTFGILKDCSLFSENESVEQDTDLLPPAVRNAFNQRLTYTDGWEGATAEVRLSRNMTPAKSTPNGEPRVKRSTSIFGFIFGGGGDDADDKSSSDTTSPAKEVNKTDSSYDIVEDDTDIDILNLVLQTVHMGDGPYGGRLAFEGNAELASAGIKKIVRNCGASGLVSGTRFFPERTLVKCLTALTMRKSSIDSSYNGMRSLDLDLPEAETIIRLNDSRMSTDLVELCKLTKTINTSIMPASTPASLAWFEKVIVDVTVRNRDRFNSFFPLLKDHYVQHLSSSLSKSSPSYITERCIEGALKIAERMMDRDGLAHEMVTFLGSMFVSSSQESIKHLTVCCNLPEGVLSEYAGHVSAGVWRIMTKNVDSLPQLTMEDWQILFNIISTCAGSGGYASIKAFEVMTWLLHEPRLKAEVPVFCVSGIRPLLQNAHLSASLSRGVIQLLMNLHDRLEVLVTEESIASSQVVDMDDQGNAVGGGPWESCWVPVLKSLADGVNDKRLDVRSYAIDNFSRALMDKHALAVPAGTLINILIKIVTPTVLTLSQSILNELNEDDSTSEGLPRTASDDTIVTSAHSIGGVGGQVDHDTDTDTDTKALSPNKVVMKALLGSTGFDNNAIPTDACLVSLCESFLCQIEKLSSYPSFDKLWIELLYVFGFFLEGEHGFQHAILDSYPNKENEVAQIRVLISTTKHYLEKCLRNMTTLNMFRDRAGLWQVTQETLNNLKFSIQL
jgi:hypothetical protein